MEIYLSCLRNVLQRENPPSEQLLNPSAFIGPLWTCAPKLNIFRALRMR